MRVILVLVCLAAACATLGALPAVAQNADSWVILVGDGGTGSSIGVWPSARDGWEYGNWPLRLDPSWAGVFVSMYREQGPGWDGPTGFFSGDEYPPIPAGGSRTWADFYLWAQNYTPNAGALTHVGPDNNPDGPAPPPPAGYMGHLVMDQVPGDYTGPMDYWLDMTRGYNLALPIPVVSDPLQGTRFHLTVYAPVPEPSSLAAFALGAIPLAGALTRRRR
jgi:hypothetical protein